MHSTLGTYLEYLLMLVFCSFAFSEYNCEYKKDGFYADPDFCHIYWRCNYGVPEEYECPAGTAWNHVESRCDWLDNVDCNRVDDGDEKKEEKEDEEEPKEEEQTTKKSKATKKSKTTTTDPLMDATNSFSTLPSFEIELDTKNPLDKPNAISMCTMSGTYVMPDTSNCASYYNCKDGKEMKMVCPEKHLFNIDTSACEESQKVFCGTRAVILGEKNQCQSKRDGIYPDLERACKVFFQCINQQKIREANCPNSLKFNSLTGRCDNPTNIVAPCGTHSTTSSAVKLKTFYGLVFSIVYCVMAKSL